MPKLCATAKLENQGQMGKTMPENSQSKKKFLQPSCSKMPSLNYVTF